MLGFSGTREWVYPLAVDGRFQRLRRWTFLGLSIAEVAARTGLPVGTTKSRLHYATRALRASVDADARTSPPSQERMA